MSTGKRLNEVLASAKKIPFDGGAKFIFFSDCHRGNNDRADDFAPQQWLFFYALQHYYEAGFTYIELGDGDELWENKKFEAIRKAHSHVFWIMREFYLKNRFYLIWGNHDMERKNPKIVEKTLYHYYDERTHRMEPLFEGIEVHEGLVLQDSLTSDKIFLVHGHQGDLFNDRWWRLTRFMVRHFWRHLQLFGVNDPTSPAKNFKKRTELERRLIAWVKANKQVLITGHNHRPRFPEVGHPPYFNCGSCVHPRCITGIEIDSGAIMLIKWWIMPDQDGALHVTRETLAGPEELSSFFNSNEGDSP